MVGWQSVGQRIRRNRAASGWSQDTLAAFSGVSCKTINALECGRTRPSSGVVACIAAALGCPVADLDPDGAARERAHPIRVMPERLPELVVLAMRRGCSIASLVDEAVNRMLGR